MENTSISYKTTDLYLAAYLKIKGHNLTIERVKSRANFCFIESPELLSDVNEYFMETGSCEPLAFTNQIKNLKNLLFNS